MNEGESNVRITLGEDSSNEFLDKLTSYFTEILVKKGVALSKAKEKAMALREEIREEASVARNEDEARRIIEEFALEQARRIKGDNMIHEKTSMELLEKFLNPKHKYAHTPPPFKIVGVFENRREAERKTTELLSSPHPPHLTYGYEYDKSLGKFIVKEYDQSKGAAFLF